MNRNQASDLNTEYKHLRLSPDQAVAYRDSGGDGPAVLFIHDFASFSHTWSDMLPYMPENFRYIRVDLNGFGFSLFQTDETCSTFDHADILSKFIQQLDLRNITLVGQGLGGDVALLLTCDPEILTRLNSLVLISCGSFQERIPEYISTISTLATGRVLRFAHSRFLARMMLKYAYANTDSISEKTLNAYTAMLSHPGRLDSIIRAARSYKQPDPEIISTILAGLELPVLLVYGKRDSITPPAQLDAYRKILRNPITILLPESGHLPQEEFPQETAKILGDFIQRRIPRQPEQKAVQILEVPQTLREQPPRLRRLFDKWSPGAFLLILVLKCLQFFRHLGMKAEAHGWRRITSIFLRGEYSKFVLASFRLTYTGNHIPENRNEAREILSQKLYDFLQTRKELHWSVEPGFFSFGRHKISLCDIVETEIDRNGNILSLKPFFDVRHSQLINLTEEQVYIAIKNIIRICNSCKDQPDRNHHRVLQNTLKKWAGQAKGFNFLSRRNLHLFIERIMASTFLYIDQASSNAAERTATPDIRIRRHPGWGMLSITARMTPDFREVDLWFQFHHMNADGAPMQEMLTELKKQWGSAGEIIYPAQNLPVMLFETMDCGEDIFRTRLHIDFSEILRLRKFLNTHFMARMNGSVSLAGLLLWGLAGHEAFRDKKMLLPVDLGTSEQDERVLGLLFIRPGLFRDEQNPFEGFMNFQRELNQRMNAVRTGHSESHEFLSLCSMLHPVLCHMARILTPHDLHEIVGSMGLSIIRDAEMFISPLTDFQTNGFVSLGSVRMKTENGKFVGSLCICGSRSHIRNYIQAFRLFILHFPEQLNLPNGWDKM